MQTPAATVGPTLLAFAAAAGASSLLFLWALSNRDREAAAPFAVFAATLVIWNLLQVVELAGGRTAAYYASFGIRATRAVMAVSWFYFTVTFAGYRDVLKRRPVKLLVAAGAIYLFVFTGIPPIATTYTFALSGFTDVAQITHIEGGATPFRRLTQFTGYSFVAIGTLTLGYRLLNTGYARHWQTGLFVVVALLSLVFDLLFERPIEPIPGVDYAALTTTVVAATFVLTIYRTELFGHAPVVREYIVDTVADAVIVLNPNYQILDYNDAAEQLCAEPLSRGGDGAAALPSVIRTDPLVTEFEEGRTTVTFSAADGTRHFDMSTSTISATGTVTALVLVLRDVTEREQQRAELKTRHQELVRKNERLERFSEIVSHDLRNPLNIASGQIELAYQQDDLDGRYDTIIDALDRMDEIIDDTLTLARQGQTVTETEPVPLRAVVENCWANVATNGATLTVDGDGTIEADQGRLQHLFENLFRNAVEHSSTDSGSEAQQERGITITVGITDDGFYVADNGTGIPESEREHVFDSGYSTDEDGTGFGLSIVEEIVAAHGWEISVTDSEAGGARFEITGVTRDPPSASI